MKVSWLRLDNDKKSFRLPENLGFEVYSINDYDNVDKKIDELIANKYDTIIISNEIAGLSQKINKEYLQNKNINIVISKNNS